MAHCTHILLNRRRHGHGASDNRQFDNSGASKLEGMAHDKKGQNSQALGKSRGGFSAKAHISVDALGNPLRFILTSGEKR